MHNSKSVNSMFLTINLKCFKMLKTLSLLILIELCLIGFPSYSFFQSKGLKCNLKTIIQKDELCL
jgi:hypothetical protein